MWACAIPFARSRYVLKESQSQRCRRRWWTKTSFCFCWKEAACRKPTIGTNSPGIRDKFILVFFLSSTKYKMQDPIEVPLLPIVAETVSHTMYCRAGGGKSEVVVLLEPYSPLSTSNDVWLHQGLPHSWTMINSSHDMAYSSFCDSMCSVGAHQQAQDHRSRSFGNAHARRLEAAAEHAHLSKYKVCLSFKAWQVYWTSDDFPITAPKVHFSWSLKVRKSWREICALCRCGYWRVWQGHAQSTKFSEHKSPAFWLLPNCNIFACTITSSPSLVILYIPLL